MKTVLVSMFALLFVCLIISGCTQTQVRASQGAAIGAGAGAIIGHQSGSGGEGAAVGAVVGGLIGALVGDAEEQRAAESEPIGEEIIVIHPAPSGYLTKPEVVEMSRNNISDDVIISQIRATNTSFLLSADDIIALSEKGVSQRVIDYMIQTRR